MAHMKRSEMEAVITGGGSILHKGRTITRIADLPNSEDLAAGDPALESLAADELDAQIAALQARRQKLNTSADETPPNTSTSATSNPPSDELAVFDKEVAERLRGAGLTTLAAVRAATDEQLDAISGIGEGTIKRIREAQGS